MAATGSLAGLAGLAAYTPSDTWPRTAIQSPFRPIATAGHQTLEIDERLHAIHWYENI
jgi:hypothetical protein